MQIASSWHTGPICPLKLMRESVYSNMETKAQHDWNRMESTTGGPVILRNS